MKWSHMSYAIIGLLFVLVVVFAVLASKTWHWVNIVFVVLIFITGVTASVGLSQSLALRRIDMNEAKRYEALAERLTEEANVALNGPMEVIGFGPDSLRGVAEELEREMYGRGRVWSSGVVTVNAENRVFKFPVARGDDQQIPMNGIVVYAFADGTSEDGLVYPFEYIGKFRVVAEASEQVELEPLFVAATSRYSDITGSWSLFEKMPIDRRDAFKKSEGITDENFDIATYREIVTTKLPANQLGFDLNNQEDAKSYEALIDRYAFDGLTLGEILNYIEAESDAGRRISTDFEPSPEETFIEFKFDKKTSAEFEVDATANLKEDGNFSNGRATNPALQAGEKISFAKGDTVLIDQLSAEGFQRDGGIKVPAFTSAYPVSEINRYFFRQLKNYPFMLFNLQRQTAKMKSETERVKKGIETTDNAIADANKQTAIRDSDKNKLTTDLDNFQNDADVIAKLLQQRTAQLEEVEKRVKALRSEFDALYQSIHGEVTSVEPIRKRQFVGR